MVPIFKSKTLITDLYSMSPPDSRGLLLFYHLYKAEIGGPKDVLTTSQNGTGIVRIKPLKKFTEFQPRIAKVLRPTFQWAAPFRDALGMVTSSVVGGSSDQMELNLTIRLTDRGLQEISFAFKDGGIFFKGLKLYFDVVTPQGQ
jgi:hypothetical protein